MAPGHPPRTSRNEGAVALLVVAALVLVAVWYFTSDPRGRRTTPSAAAGGVAAQGRDDEPVVPASARDPRVLGFLDWVDERAGGASNGRATAVTAEGIHRLARAMTVLAIRDSAGGLAQGGRIAALDSIADQIVRATPPSRQGELASTAFIAAAGMLQEMHRRRFPNVKNEVVETRLAADAVRRTSGLGGQLRSVDQFFARAATAVRRMSEAR